MGGRELLEKPPDHWTVTIAEVEGARVSVRRNAALETWAGASALPVVMTVDLVPVADPRVAPQARVQELDVFEGRLLSAIRDKGVAAVIMSDGGWRRLSCYVAATVQAGDIEATAGAILRHHRHHIAFEPDPEWTAFQRLDIRPPSLLGVRPPVDVGGGAAVGSAWAGGGG